MTHLESLTRTLARMFSAGILLCCIGISQTDSASAAVKTTHWSQSHQAQSHDSSSQMSPTNLTPLVTPGLAGEGVWHAVGRKVSGQTAIYTTHIRPPNNPSIIAGAAWINQSLVRATLYSGSLSPGGLFWKNTAPVSQSAAKTLVAAFNGGFQMKDAHGGYLSEGHLVSPLIKGAASLVIDKNGTISIGSWGSGVSMNANVVAVRQNLTLLISNGVVASNLNPNDTTAWGTSLHYIVNTPRSGLGETASGNLVYVEGEMNIVSLAKILLDAGAVNAMVLDMNPAWPFFSWYTPSTANGPATLTNGGLLNTYMTPKPQRIFESSYNRDFITLSAR